MARRTSSENYFYLNEKLAFGFANTEYINLNPADDAGDKFRLSWPLNNSGGSRLSTKK